MQVREEPLILLGFPKYECLSCQDAKGQNAKPPTCLKGLIPYFRKGKTTYVSECAHSIFRGNTQECVWQRLETILYHLHHLMPNCLN